MHYSRLRHRLLTTAFAVLVVGIVAQGALAQNPAQSPAIEPCPATPSPQAAAASVPAKVSSKVSQTAVDASIPDDPALQKIVSAYSPKVRELSAVIGTLEGELKKSGVGGASLGNFVTDAMMFEAREKGHPVALAITNSGGFRKNTIAPGQLRASDIFELLPFENALVEVELTGAQLLKLLENAHDLAARGLATIPREVAPVPADTTAQQQFSFSRLTGKLIRPHFQRATAGLPSSDPTIVDARGLGTLVHDVLERIDFAHPADIAAWCEHLAPSHVIQNTEHAAKLACNMIERFTKSSRGRELATATTVHREIDFLLAWPPGERNTTGRYIQGVIDCLYQDAAGRWHIADFKTNDVTAAKVSQEANQYELQLHVYAIAIERTLGQSPTELVLHFLRPGAEHVIPWNDSAREHAIAKVNELIIDTMETADDLVEAASV